MALAVTPFDLIVLILACSSLRKAIGWVFFGESSVAGLHVVQRGDELRVRMDSSSPLKVTLGWLALALIGSWFLSIITEGEVALGLFLVVEAIIFGGAVLIYVIEAARLRGGRMDLVIDRAQATLTLPATCGRGEAVTIRAADLVSVDLATVSARSPAINWHGDRGATKEARLIESLEEAEAAQFVAWLRARLLGINARSRGS